MFKLKSVLVLSATATLLSAAPALAQYGSGSSGVSAPTISQSRVTATKANAADRRALRKRQDAFSKREELERKIARQEAQAANYGSGTQAAKKAAQDTASDAVEGVKDKAYGSATQGAQDAAGKVTPNAYGSGTEGVKDKAYGSGTEAAKDKAYGSGTKGVKDTAYGSGTEGAKAAQEAKDKAYGSADKGATTTQEKAYGSGHSSGAATPTEGYNSGTTTGSSLPVNCPAGSKAQPNGTCLLVDSSLLGL